MKKQPHRTVKLVTTDIETILTITVNGKPTNYRLEEIQSDDAPVAVQLSKLDEDGVTVEKYGVELYTVNGYHGCDCHGFTAHSHCKHVESLVALHRAGRLNAKPVCKAMSASA